jgi:hypothetical protein
MRFLLLCCADEQRWNALPEAQRNDIMKAYGAWIADLDRSGRHVATVKLQPAAGARTVREVNGEASITDGPFAETKEQIGGYHLIDCADATEALAIAQRIPTLSCGGAVEVRPLDSNYPQR